MKDQIKISGPYRKGNLFWIKALWHDPDSGEPFILNEMIGVYDYLNWNFSHYANVRRRTIDRLKDRLVDSLILEKETPNEGFDSCSGIVSGIWFCGT